MAACNTRERLSEMNPDAAKYFIEKLLYQIYEHFDEQDLIDVTFKFSSNPSVFVTAHRLILSSASVYFRELFKSEAGICPLIEITNIDSDTFESLIVFCYTGKTSINIDNVEKILKAALILQLDEAVANCAEFIVANITDFTLQRAYTLERDNSCQILNEKIFEYETRNFMSITQSAEFLNFEANKLQNILECATLNAPSEKVVFEAVKRWYEHDALGRKQQLPDLIACLRLTQLDMDFLVTEVKPLPGCELVAYKAISWISCPSLRNKLTLKYTEQRGNQSTESEDLLLALHLWEKTIFQYDKIEDSWRKWGDIEIDVSYVKVALMDEDLIFIGGSRNGNAINEVTSWNCKTKTSKRLPSMNQARFGHSLALLNNEIYAIGGWGTDIRGLNSVERYSVSLGWQSVNNMIEPRHSAAAFALNNKIYVMGGYNENSLKLLKSVECYDPTTDRWTQCADMNQPRRLHSATVHNGQIFVVSGGYTPSVERYDAQKNEWTKICSLGKSIGGVGCISYDTQLWAVGGSNSDLVSVYSAENDEWIRQNPIGLAGPYYCFTLPKGVLQSE